jgi:hypothetical protein
MQTTMSQRQADARRLMAVLARATSQEYRGIGCLHLLRLDVQGMLSSWELAEVPVQVAAPSCW